MLIGLAGAAESGKDTVYGMLRALSFEGPLTPYLVRRDAFADRLKVSAARALGYKGPPEACIAYMNLFKTQGEIRAILTDGSRPSGGSSLCSLWMASIVRLWRRYKYSKGRWISGREYLQYYGTEAHRDVFTYDFWVKAVLPDGYPSEAEQKKTLLVVTDVRFLNEAERVRECGGEVWKVVRPQEGIAESAHASETPLPDEVIDYIINNDGDKDALFERVKVAVNERLLCSSTSS